MSTTPWSGFCRAYMAQAAVRLCAPSSATDWEQELVELTGHRGLPVLHGVVFGRDAAADAPPTWRTDDVLYTRFAWSHELGPLYIGEPGGPGSHRAVSSWRGLHLSSDWRDWIERLVRVDAMPPYPPPLVVLDRGGSFLGPGDSLASDLGLRQEPTGDATKPVFAGGDTLLVAGYPYDASGERVYAAHPGALDRALRVADAAQLPWCFDTLSLPLDALPPRPVEAVGEHRRATAFGVLRVTLGRDVLRQELELLGTPIETAIFARDGAARCFAFAPPAGSARVEAWARARRVLRCPHLQLDEAAAQTWARVRRLPAWPALRTCERELGGLVAPADAAPMDADPLGRPAVLLGLGVLARAPEELVRWWNLTSQDPAEEPAIMSCGVEEPRARGYLVWSWREHTLVVIGEWRERILCCDERGAIWRHDGNDGVLDVASGTPRTLLERVALEEQLWRELGHWVPVHVFADVGAQVAGQLGLSAIAEATDHLVQTYEGDGLWLWQLVEYGPNRTEIRVVGQDVSRVVDVVRAARALAPEARVKVWSSTRPGNLLVDALVEAGLGDPWSLTASAHLEAELAASPESSEGDLG
ncbi:hypothetical protein [Sorangium sp. So ce1099]|uniref:hypothetical protein n=1 Tax=Sorangium sp. So ce1099 TaxID=3133331 RepID=UPI003F63066E